MSLERNREVAETVARQDWGGVQIHARSIAPPVKARGFGMTQRGWLPHILRFGRRRFARNDMV